MDCRQPASARRGGAHRVRAGHPRSAAANRFRNASFPRHRVQAWMPGRSGSRATCERFCCAAWIFWPMVCVCILVASGYGWFAWLGGNRAQLGLCFCWLAEHFGEDIARETLGERQGIRVRRNGDQRAFEQLLLDESERAVLRVGLLGQRLPRQRLKPDARRCAGCPRAPGRGCIAPSATCRI